MNWALLFNSAAVSAATALLAGAAGFLAALRMATAGPGARRMLQVATLMTLALPPFLVVNNWLELLSPNGALRQWLPVELHSLGGTVAVLLVMYWPVSALLTLGALERVEPARMECDPLMKGRVLLRWVLWPAVRTSAGLAALLIFVLAFNQFSIPVILQVPVYPEELWLALTTRLNEEGAWAAAVPMIVVPFLFLILAGRREFSWPRESGRNAQRILARQLGPAWIRSATIATVALLAVGLGVPLGRLLFRGRTWEELPKLLRAAPDVAFNSFLYASVPATIAVALALLAWSRLRPVRWVLWLLFFMPGVLMGQALILGLSQTVFYGTSLMVMMALALRYVAVSWESMARAGHAMDSNLLDAGRMEGARGWTLFRYYAWPQLARPVTATWFVIYLLALWDVETLVLIYPPGGETLALRIFNLLHYGHNAQVNAMCVTLLALALFPIVLWQGGRFVAGLWRHS